MGKWRFLRKDTLEILNMPAHFTNRQVADITGYEIERVKEVRRRHGVVYNKTPKDRGLRDKILAIDFSIPAKELAEQLGCSRPYVSQVRRQRV